MTTPKALFDKYAPLEYPSGIVPNLKRLKKNQVPKQQVRKKQRTKPPRPGFLYLVQIQTPDDRLFYKLGVSTSETLTRYNKVHIDVKLIIMVPTTMERAQTAKLQFLREHKEYHGLYPERFAFKGYQDCLSLPPAKVDELVTQINAI